VGLDAKFLMEKRKSFGTDRNGENGKLLAGVVVKAVIQSIHLISTGVSNLFLKRRTPR
jgi:hypothetical protein